MENKLCLLEKNLNYVFNWKSKVEKNDKILKKSLQNQGEKCQLLVVEVNFVVFLSFKIFISKL